MIVQIDAEAAIPAAPPRYTRPYTFDNWHGQGFPWHGSMVLATDEEFFVRGQTGSGLDHSGVMAKGRTAADAAAQADLAMTNLATILGEAGAAPEDICKTHGLYRRPCLSPGGLSDDRQASRRCPAGLDRHHHDRHSPGPTSCSSSISWCCASRAARRIGGCVPIIRAPRVTAISGQQLDCEFCMAVVAGDRVILRGQTGMGLDEKLYGVGDAKAQAEQAMRNVETLLQEAGAGLANVVKATVYVTDRAFLADVNEAVLRRLGGRAGLHFRDREGARQPGAADGGRYRGDQGAAHDVLDRGALRPDRDARSGRHDVIDRGRLTLRLRGRRHRGGADAAHDRPAARPA